MAGFEDWGELIEGRHFDQTIVIFYVKWHRRFRLSFRDLVKMTAQRGRSMVHTAIVRWVRHYSFIRVRSSE
jgi:transposase-like protein